MRLAELNPKWILRDGQKVGFTFLCPHCKDWSIFCTTTGMTIKEQCGLLAEQMPGNGGRVIPATAGLAWGKSGEDFDSITITPSIDASASKCWHGFITNGEIK